MGEIVELQECLAWLADPYKGQEHMRLAPTIRAQLEAGKQCAEAMKGLVSDFNDRVADGAELNPGTMCELSECKTALSRATATGLIASEKVVP